VTAITARLRSRPDHTCAGRTIVANSADIARPMGCAMNTPSGEPPFLAFMLILALAWLVAFVVVLLTVW